MHIAIIVFIYVYKCMYIICYQVKRAHPKQQDVELHRHVRHE